MTKTEHYQLNQWDAADRVLRTDFNGDNAKIDAALHALSQKGALTRLKTFTTTAAVTGTADFSMDVGDIDWGAWQVVYIDLALLGSGYMLLYPNGNKNGASSQGYVTSSSYKSLAGMVECGGLCRAEFQVFRRSDRPVRTVCTYNCITGRSDYACGALQTLHLTPYHESYTMAAGSTVTLWGLR